MRIVYLGTSEFAAAVLRALAETAHRPQLVVSRPDRPRGRGRKLAPPPVALAAQELGIPLDQPDSVNSDDARERIAATAPEVLCVCAFGALIKGPLLSDHEILNVHPSLLPRWRGAAPIERAIMAGDAETGVCIMRLTAGLDSGPVALSARTAIGARDTYGTVSGRLRQIGATLLISALDAGPGGLEFVDQAEAGVTYAEKLSAADRVLDPTLPADRLERIVRALSPHIGAALIMADDARLGVLEATARPAGEGDPAAGELALDGELPLLGCGERSTLQLDVVRPAGRREMDAAAFLRGLRG